eukprot:445077_1
MAAGYDNINDTIWLLGGCDGEDFSGCDFKQLVEFERGSDTITDHGTSVFTQVIDGWGQYYSQTDKYLYIIGYLSVHRFNLHNRAMDYNHYTIPVDVSATGCLCILDIDNGYLIINGGHNINYNFLNTVQILNISSNQWLSNISSLHTARRAHTCQTFSSIVFSIGGHDDSNILDTVEIYNLNDNQWNYINDTLSTGIYSMLSVVYQNEIVIFGGHDISGTVDTINIINGITYQICTDTAYIDSAVFLHTAINAANTIYLFGGWNGTQYSSSWRSVQPNSFSPSQFPTFTPTSSATYNPSRIGFITSIQPTNLPSNPPNIKTSLTHSTFYFAPTVHKYEIN